MRPWNKILGTLCGGALLLTFGCSNSEDTRKACPTQGLGVVATSGKKCSDVTAQTDPAYKDCADQLANWREYACGQPQVSPDIGAFPIPSYPFDATAAGTQVSFTLRNATYAAAPLVISKVEFVGDERCAFRFNPLPLAEGGDVQDYVIPPGGEKLIQSIYRPKAVGEDNGHIIVYSNAQNFPKLVLAVCARAIPRFPPGQDSGAAPAKDGAVLVDAASQTLRCKDLPATPTIADCHKPTAKADGGAKTPDSKQ